MPTPLRQIDRFAEALAKSEGTSWDGDVGLAAAHIGLPRKSGNAMMQRLRRVMGPQAV